jgi:hypothetical protein
MCGPGGRAGVTHAIHHHRDQVTSVMKGSFVALSVTKDPFMTRALGRHWTQR